MTRRQAPVTATPLLDAMLNRRIVKGPQCGMQTLLDMLPAADAEQLRAALAMSRALIPHTVVADETNARLVELGIDFRLTADIVGRHRKNRCLCSKIPEG